MPYLIASRSSNLSRCGIPGICFALLEKSIAIPKQYRIILCIEVFAIQCTLLYYFITTTMLQGVVKFFNQEKGFGFIKYDGDKEIFVHITAVDNKEPLNEGDEVSFEIGDGKKGPMAVNVSFAGGGHAMADDSDDMSDDDMSA